jgi:hypothetical protein
MQMIAHHDVAWQLPTMPDRGAFEHFNQPASVRIIADDLLPGIAPRRHLVNGALKFDTKSSSHARTLDIRQPIVNLETKNNA